MAEVEYKGIRIGGSKLLLILPLIGTLCGSLWAGFEFWKDYQNLNKAVANFKPVNVTDIRKSQAVQAESMAATEKEMASIRARVNEVLTIAKDLRENVRLDSTKIYKAISDVDRRSRALDQETRAAMRSAEATLRSISSNAATRFDAKINTLDGRLASADERLAAMQKRIQKQIRDALNNPLLRK
jgi:membrane-associated HD superfamily phosphohydrolase